MASKEAEELVGEDLVLDCIELCIPYLVPKYTVSLKTEQRPVAFASVACIFGTPDEAEKFLSSLFLACLSSHCPITS